MGVVQAATDRETVDRLYLVGIADVRRRTARERVPEIVTDVDVDRAVRHCAGEGGHVGHTLVEQQIPRRRNGDGGILVRLDRAAAAEVDFLADIVGGEVAPATRAAVDVVTQLDAGVDIALGHRCVAAVVEEVAEGIAVLGIEAARDAHILCQRRRGEGDGGGSEQQRGEKKLTHSGLLSGV